MYIRLHLSLSISLSLYLYIYIYTHRIIGSQTTTTILNNSHTQYYDKKQVVSLRYEQPFYRHVASEVDAGAALDESGQGRRTVGKQDPWQPPSTHFNNLNNDNNADNKDKATKHTKHTTRLPFLSLDHGPCIGACRRSYICPEKGLLPTSGGGTLASPVGVRRDLYELSWGQTFIYIYHFILYYSLV